MKHLISLGAGVQSSTMALMAAHGEIIPMPDAAIFADTQAEPLKVYEWLKVLEALLPFPVHRVTAGDLRAEILGAARGHNRIHARPPFFTTGGGMLNRQCTQDFKLRPIMKKVRELVGLVPRSKGPNEILVVQWIGISFDERIRIRDSRFHWMQYRYPLVDMGVSRGDCLRWLESHGLTSPPKSACTFCPYHNNKLWSEMRRNDPDSFLDACQVDEAIRNNIPKQKEQWFVHRDLVPLSQVDFRTAEDRGQINMFINECEGMCGV